MVTLAHAAAPEPFIRDNTYETRFNHWNGHLTRIPLMRSIVNIRAGSVTSSYRLKGNNRDTAAEVLGNMRGRGNETFKLIISNMYKMAWICGDSYAEKIGRGKQLVDLEVLPPDNIQQVYKRGRIVRFVEIDTQAKFKPDEIFHYTYHPIGAMQHGLSVLEPMHNLLIDYLQAWQDFSELIANIIKPREVIYTNTDNLVKNQAIADKFTSGDKSMRGKIFLPSGLVTKYEIHVPTTGYDPAKRIDELRGEILLATHTPELILGTGYTTSEEDARDRIAGYRGSVRDDQEEAEEHIETQILREIYPKDAPTIEFSYANEAQDEYYTRMRDTIQTVSGLNVPDEVKNDIIGDLLRQMGHLKE